LPCCFSPEAQFALLLFTQARCALLFFIRDPICPVAFHPSPMCPVVFHPSLMCPVVFHPMCPQLWELGTLCWSLRVTCYIGLGGGLVARTALGTLAIQVQSRFDPWQVRLLYIWMYTPALLVCFGRDIALPKKFFFFLILVLGTKYRALGIKASWCIHYCDRAHCAYPLCLSSSLFYLHLFSAPA
jgi:hypothetical protein